MKKLHVQIAVIAEWRQAANEATTADAAATYIECADRLQAAIGVKTLIAVCEGCGTQVSMPTDHPGKVYPDLPAGWSQLGLSRHRLHGHTRRLAVWCPACRATRVPSQTEKAK